MPGFISLCKGGREDTSAAKSNPGVKSLRSMPLKAHPLLPCKTLGAIPENSLASHNLSNMACANKFAGKWMECITKLILLNEMTQTRKEKCHEFSQIWGSWPQIFRFRSITWPAETKKFKKNHDRGVPERGITGRGQVIWRMRCGMEVALISEWKESQHRMRRGKGNPGLALHALRRLGHGDWGELKAFWDTISKNWTTTTRAATVTQQKQQNQRTGVQSVLGLIGGSASLLGWALRPSF